MTKMTANQIRWWSSCQKPLTRRDLESSLEHVVKYVPEDVLWTIMGHLRNVQFGHDDVMIVISEVASDYLDGQDEEMAFEDALLGWDESYKYADPYSPRMDDKSWNKTREEIAHFFWEHCFPNKVVFTWPEYVEPGWMYDRLTPLELYYSIRTSQQDMSNAELAEALHQRNPEFTFIVAKEPRHPEYRYLVIQASTGD